MSMTWLCPKAEGVGLLATLEAAAWYTKFQMLAKRPGNWL